MQKWVIALVDQKRWKKERRKEVWDKFNEWLVYNQIEVYLNYVAKGIIVAFAEPGTIKLIRTCPLVTCVGRKDEEDTDYASVSHNPSYQPQNG